MTIGEERKEHDNARLLWSDKGYVHCEVRVIMGTCDNCGAKSLDPGSEKINVAPSVSSAMSLPKSAGSTASPSMMQDHGNLATVSTITGKR
jgi:hypothetical protein